MGILQVGAKLVRTFGKDSHATHVITETVGNKTFTRVLDNKGELLARRVKEISRQNIGEKSVITRKVDWHDGWGIYKYQKDLVYDKQGKFLGMRVINGNNILKVNSDYVGRLKKIFSTTDESIYGKLLHGRQVRTLDLDKVKLFEGEPVKTFHTYNGIPIPQSLTNPELEKFGTVRRYQKLNMPLREMVDKNTNAFSKGSGYEQLNYAEPKFNIIEYAKNLINKG